MRKCKCLSLVDAEGRPLSRRAVLLMAAGAPLVAACSISPPESDAAADVPLSNDANELPDGADAAPSDGDAGPACRGIFVGVLSDFALGTVVRAPRGNVFVGHDDGGLYAMTTLCTHMGYPLADPAGETIRCMSGHGGIFNFNGEPINGPPPRPLQHYAVTLCGDQVFVDSTQPVPITQRTPVPG